MISRNSDQIPQKSRRKITNLRRFQQHFAKISKNYRNFANFRKKSANFEFKAVQRYVYLVDLEECQKNEYLVAKFGLDTAENEPSEKCAFGCCYMNLRPTLYEKIEGTSKVHAIHRSRRVLLRMLWIAKIGVNTAEHGPSIVCSRHPC